MNAISFLNMPDISFLLSQFLTGHLSLKWAWVLVLLPLPLVIYLIDKVRNRLKHSQSSQINTNDLNGALQVPFFHQLSVQIGAVDEPPKATKKPSKWSNWWKWLLLSLTWVWLLMAVSRPMLVGEKIPLPVAGRDIMMAVDLSGSMASKDLGVQANRLDVVKATADEFINRRKGDRVGLIFFSDKAYLQAPLTFDRNVVRQLLTEADVGLVGQRTAIGDAIAIGLKRLREANSQLFGLDADTADAKTSSKASQVLILLTDGANNAGVTEPKKATEIAKKLGIKIYTIGVGGEAEAVNTPFGRRLMASSAELDEKTLQRIADETGGQYFRATDMQELEQIYQSIDELEPIDRNPQYLRPETELYHYPALYALLSFGLLMLIVVFNQITTIIPQLVAKKEKQ